jgi:hypothetical protein
MVDLPAPVGPTIASVRPGGTVKDALQDLAVRAVAEADILEADLARAARERRRAGRVAHLGRDLEQAEHLLHVRQALLDLAIGEAEDVQRQIELDQVGVDHHEVAHRHAAAGDARPGQQHRDRQPHRHDEAAWPAFSMLSVVSDRT